MEVDCEAVASARARVQRVVDTPQSPSHSQHVRTTLDFLLTRGGASSGASAAQPQAVRDLVMVLGLVNDDTTPKGRLCCASEEGWQGKVANAVCSVMYGRAEQAPGEGKWNYVIKRGSCATSSATY